MNGQSRLKIFQLSLQAFSLVHRMVGGVKLFVHVTMINGVSYNLSQVCISTRSFQHFHSIQILAAHLEAETVFVCSLASNPPAFYTSEG